MQPLLNKNHWKLARNEAEHMGTSGRTFGSNYSYVSTSFRCVSRNQRVSVHMDPSTLLFGKRTQRNDAEETEQAAAETTLYLIRRRDSGIVMETSSAIFDHCLIELNARYRESAGTSALPHHYF
jgi:hypothetical protein